MFPKLCLEERLQSESILFDEFFRISLSRFQVGDKQELNAISDVFCFECRESPMLVGSVKSNAGHAEPVSGLLSIAKVLFALETGVIPANINFETLNHHIPKLVNGELKVRNWERRNFETVIVFYQGGKWWRESYFCTFCSKLTFNIIYFFFEITEEMFVCVIDKKNLPYYNPLHKMYNWIVWWKLIWISFARLDIRQTPIKN